MTSFLFITDLDNTLVGDDAAMADLNHRLSDHRQQHGTKVVYSTGRSQTSYQRLKAKKPLLDPDVLIVSVGTEIYHAESDRPDPAWSTVLSEGWDRELVAAIAAHFADLVPQSESEQRPFKASYLLAEQSAPALLPQLQAALQQQNLDFQLIYSGGKDLDILPRRANKGQAMAFLRETLSIAPQATVACGDSGNDLSMFVDRPERGIIVGNAFPELLDWHHANPNRDRYLAKNHCAGGILEGLQYFSFL